MNCEKKIFEKFYKSRGVRVELKFKSYSQIMNRKNIFFFEKFSKSRGGGGEGRTQIQILELNHELPKKNWKKKL